MWDSSFMADMDNFSEINDNFDTIKTLLNSIRAQGILNTSDVDKLLTGINSKLEKINTEEDIDLIKIFLSELKQNLDERHSVLISKFGAIEALFSNLLKNSSEMPKSADIKELFDIVATNLSVFSREVVSQKESLTDITLRLDALRSDDSQKKDIIKSITILKSDLERLNNGFDSIVISLNDNFKTILKTLTAFDKSEYFKTFSETLSSVEMSSNTLLSALQVLDKKTGQVEEALINLATKDDISLSNRRMSELTTQSQELATIVSDLSDKYVKIDNLADKIDASVNIIAGLKSILEESSDKHASLILDQLKTLEAEVVKISSDTKFEDFKVSLESVLKGLVDSSVLLDKNILASTLEVQKVASLIDSLDINVNFRNLFTSLSNLEAGVKASINEVSQKLLNLQDANITRVINDISAGAESLEVKLNQAQATISTLCEKNFTTVFESISDLRNVVSQIDDNSISANNAIFSNITDRLTIFENSLRVSLEAQEKSVNYASSQLVEQLDSIKSLTSMLDYKMDSSVLEVGNVKREFESLKGSVDAVLALDFVSAVKDLKVDLYASKEELSSTFEASNVELSDKITNDLYGKYELLISKLDSIEDEFKKTQHSSLFDLKNILENISSSVVDVLSYVTETNSAYNASFDGKISEISAVLNEKSLNYIEAVKDVVDEVRAQVETNLVSFEANNLKNLDAIKRSISENTEDVKKDLKISYSKLLEIQDSYKEFKDLLEASSDTTLNKCQSIISATDSVRAEFDVKLNTLKANLLEKISEFKQDLTCENLETVNELKFSVENFCTKNAQDFSSLVEDLKNKYEYLSKEIDDSRATTLAKILDNFVSVKDLILLLQENTSENLASRVDIVLNEFENLKEIINSLQEDSKNDFTGQVLSLQESLVNVKDFVATVNETAVEQALNQTSILQSDLSDIKTLVEGLNKEASVQLLANIEGLHDNLANVKKLISSLNEASSATFTDKLSVVSEDLADVKGLIASTNAKAVDDLLVRVDGIFEELSTVKSVITSLNEKTAEEVTSRVLGLYEDIATVKKIIMSLNEKSIESLSIRVEGLHENLADVKSLISNTGEKIVEDLSGKVDGIQEGFISLRNLLSSLNEETSLGLYERINNLQNEFFAIKDLFVALNEKSSSEVIDRVTELQDDYNNLKSLISTSNVQTLENLSNQTSSILEDFSKVKDLVISLNEKSLESMDSKVDLILQDFAAMKAIVDKVDENIDGDMTRQLSIIESNFESLVSQMSILFEKSEISLSDKLNKEFSNISDKMQNILNEKLESYKVKIENTFDNIESKNQEQAQYLQDRISDLNSALKVVWQEQAEDNLNHIEEIAGILKNVIEENFKLTSLDYVGLKNKLTDYAKELETNNQNLTQDLKAQLDDIAKYIDSVLDIQAQEVAVKYDELSSLITEGAQKNEAIVNQINDTVNEQLGLARTASADLSALTQMTANNNNLVEGLDALIRENHEVSIIKDENILSTAKNIETTTGEAVVSIENLKNDLKSLTQIVETNKQAFAEIEASMSENFASMKSLAAEISAGELQTMDSYIERLAEQLEAEKQQFQLCKDLTNELIKNEVDLLSKSIEKETDVIIAELSEQFDLMRQAQADDVVKLTSALEDVVNAHIYNNIEDLKSYLDIKTDNSVISSKLDNIKLEIASSMEEIVNNSSKLLDTDLFTSAMSDFRVANELLVSSSISRLNEKIDNIISENGKTFEEKLALFDKKFIDVVVDKFEEVKLLSNQQGANFASIQASINDVLTEFNQAKDGLSNRVDALAEMIRKTAESTNKEVASLISCFEDLRSQISNKSFDEAFQASINKQISGLESLVTEQLGYIEDINELCVNNLPEVAELNTLVKHSILESIKEFTEKLEDNNIEEQLSSVKTEIVTQILNVFNQVSFVAEQEEIIDFIQDKHDELITVLSHIVTTTSVVDTVRDNLSVVDNKIDSLKDEIGLLNEKITAIISADGDIDYVYSLQDLEADIANLRLALNEMKNNDHGQDFSELITSTNDIYKLVESIKTELPNRADFENLAEDIVSISTRTNKLILASDESYKTLHDNLQDFKLVINDLDERTRNFAQESGMDRIDSKLNALNTMMVNGAKTSQVFNQVFEYLAEWVDKAGLQINAISDRVESLDDIEQIKLMLADLKAEASDSSESAELVEVLGTIFDKQAKRIAALETKLDKIIVETTINNNNNKVDLAPFEDTLNRFLVAMDEKMNSQQEKIDSLESKLESVVGLISEKDTATLTKKMGGMDRQIAKLNKSIEKIASHVVEK